MDGEQADLVARAKMLLRKRARGLRASMPAAALGERAERLRDRLLAHAAVREARVLALFWPIEGRKEVDLRPADAALRAEGKRLAYPAVDQASGRMTFRFVADPSELADRGLRFSEPSAEAPEAAALDVIVVPGLLFDARGYRLGYGGGYYDRTLPRYRPRAVAVGVAFDFQLAADLPHTEEDMLVDWVVTDQRLLDCAAAR